LREGERMRFSTIDIFHSTPQKCQARLLLVCFMEWATPFNEKKRS
jgi:hypothetical protein